MDERDRLRRRFRTEHPYALHLSECDERWLKQHGKRDWPRTVAAFEAWHARQPERWQFIDGQPRLIAPASMKHAIIKGNVFAALRRGLAGTPCTALVDGPQILTDEISAIPDVVVTGSAIDR